MQIRYFVPVSRLTKYFDILTDLPWLLKFVFTPVI